ncbi:MAG: replication-associated recombination protein A [Bacteriovoracaceae bacterium]
MKQSTFFDDSPSSKIDDTSKENSSAFAHKVRPKSKEDFLGFEELLKKYPHLGSKSFGHNIFWGPPGSGKTTLASLLSQIHDLEFFSLNAVLDGVGDLKKLLPKLTPRSILFIDEIHRFNKAQQDALLPSLERGDFIFLGATTESPFRTVNPAIRSRVNLVELKRPTEDESFDLLKRIAEDHDFDISSEVLSYLVKKAFGDLRKAINTLALLKEIGTDFDASKPVIDEINPNSVDQVDRYYDLISALIKSMRGSDPQAALLWLAYLIHERHDLVSVCRRLIIFASEDIGNADPSALNLATSCLLSFEKIGLPEGRIILGQTVSYLASTFKSNSSYRGIDNAIQFVKENPNHQIPKILKNQKGTDYRYPHSYPGNFVKQDYRGTDLPNFYNPSLNGKEIPLKQRLDEFWGD